MSNIDLSKPVYCGGELINEKKEKVIFMTRKTVIARPEFIKAIKAEIAANKERHNQLYSKITLGIAQKLKKMKGE
jgi:hypothetical protein